MAKSGKFELFAALVASGRTIASCADELKIGRRTAYRVASRDSFRKRVAEIRDEVTQAAVGRLSAAASQAASTLASLLDEDYEPQIRLNASKAILSSLGPLAELGELRERVQRLESARELEASR